jgi:hypothetical protein
VDGGGSTPTKFCSTGEQQERAENLESDDAIQYEYYCCRTKCVSSIVYETFCCEEEEEGGHGCSRKQLDARRKAGYSRVLRERDDVVNNVIQGSSDRTDSTTDQETENNLLMPRKEELDPFKTHSLKSVQKIVRDDPAEQIVKFGPGAMAPPSGWSQDTKRNRNPDAHRHVKYPMVPPQFRKKEKGGGEGRCCGEELTQGDKLVGKGHDAAMRKPPMKARSFQEYDPYPTSNPVCPVSMLTVKREDLAESGGETAGVSIFFFYDDRSYI